MNYTLSLEQIKELTTSMRTEILESPAFLSYDILNEMGINVLTGIEFRDLQYAIKRKGGTTRPYKAGQVVNNSTGELEQVELIVKLAMNRFVDNIQYYREKEPFHVDVNGNYVASNSQVNIRQICTEFTEDILSNIFFGQYSINGEFGALSNYDGYLKKIAEGVEQKKVKVIKTSPFVPTTDATKSDNWETIVSFVGKLPPPLKRAARGSEGVYILLSPSAKALILDSFSRTFPAIKPDDISDVDLKFLNLGNYHFITADLMGDGNLMIATTKGNFDFGVDSLNNSASVEVDRDNTDFNNIIYQIQSAQGVRIKDLGKVAINDQANTFEPSDYVGDYMDEDDNKVIKFSAEGGLEVVSSSDDDEETP